MAYSNLLLLTKAPNKKFVDEVFVAVFANNESSVDLVSALQISEEEAQQLVSAVRNLIRQYLRDFPNVKLATILPTDFQTNLRDLFDKILAHHSPEWREAVISNQPSLPKLISMDYRVDIKSGSEAISRMSVPTVLVDLKVSKPPTKVTDEPEQQNVVFELNIETINTIMDSLKFVQGQLNSIK